MSHVKPDDELQAELIRQLAARQVVVVVGAGVSLAASGMESVAGWGGLLKHGVERCRAVRQADDRWVARQMQAIEEGDLDEWLAVAENVASKLNKAPGEYGRWLRETVGKLEVRDPAVLRALRRLNVPLVTTNYDSLLEIGTAGEASDTPRPYISARRTTTYRLSLTPRALGHLSRELGSGSTCATARR